MEGNTFVDRYTSVTISIGYNCQWAVIFLSIRDDLILALFYSEQGGDRIAMAKV